MNGLLIDNQSILHCRNCGGTFFDENGINRIEEKSAEKLSQDKVNFFIADKEKLCPRDATLLEPTSAGENVPPEVTLLRCNTCHGVFVFSDDLLKFKKAQAAKIDYFKLWGIPLPSVRSIAVISIVLFITAVSFSTFTYWQQQNISNIQAQDLIKNLYITHSNRYLLISFKTSLPLKARVIFHDITSGQTFEKTINDEPSLFHELTTGDVNLAHDIFYQVILTDKKGKEAKTEVRRLDIK